MNTLYCNVYKTSDSSTHIINPILTTVNASHGSSTTLAVIETKTNPFNLSDHITVDMGYSDNHEILFNGYVTSIQYSVPDNIYTITANDDLIRAADFFIVSGDPTTPLSYQNITGEETIRSLLALASLTNVDLETTNFTFGVNNAFEINQVSIYDYCKTIVDLICFTLWCDQNGVIHLSKLTPYVNGGIENAPTLSYTWDDVNTTTTINYNIDEKDLRNKVIVYGANGLHAEATDEDSPYFHWKTAVLVAQDLLDTQAFVDDTANYNLDLFNRLTKLLSTVVVGDPTLLPHNRIVVDSAVDSSLNDTYYIFSAEHRLSSNGYTTALELRV